MRTAHRDWPTQKRRSLMHSQAPSPSFLHPPATAGPGLLLVLCGPSGAGKGTVVAGLLSRGEQAGYQLAFSVSMTTRPMRPGEVEGRSYFFVTREAFESRLREEGFLEHAEYAGHLYGTPRPPVEQALAAGQVVLLEIDLQGALQIKRTYPDAVMVFLMPPSFEELEQRLRRRGTETPDVIEKRLAIAREEHRGAHEFTYYVSNAAVSEAVSDLDGIIRAERCKLRRLCPGGIPQDHP